MPFHDLIVAVRILRKSPVFTVTAILTIALGVGASTAIFSVTNAVLLQPLPYKHPGRLVIAGMDLRQRHVRDLPFSNADFIDLKEGTKELFEDMAGVFTFRAVVPREDGTPEQIRRAVVTTNFFQVTGAQIVAGRDFTAEDGTPQPPAPPFRRCRASRFSAMNIFRGALAVTRECSAIVCRPRAALRQLLWACSRRAFTFTFRRAPTLKPRRTCGPPTG